MPHIEIRQGPSFGIRIIIGIFCSDSLVLISISPVSTVIFRNSERAMDHLNGLTFIIPIFVDVRTVCSEKCDGKVNLLDSVENLRRFLPRPPTILSPME